MEIQKVYDNGNMVEPSIVCQTAEEIIAKFKKHISNMTALSLELGEINASSIPQIMGQAFKNILALSTEIGYTMPEIGDLS